MLKKECMKFKWTCFVREFHLLKEGISQDDIDSALSIVND